MPVFHAEVLKITASGDYEVVPLTINSPGLTIVSQELGSEWIVEGVSLGPNAPVLYSDTLPFTYLNGSSGNLLSAVTFENGTDVFVLPPNNIDVNNIGTVTLPALTTEQTSEKFARLNSLLDEATTVYAANVVFVNRDSAGVITSVHTGEFYLVDDDPVMEIGLDYGGLGETGAEPFTTTFPGAYLLDTTDPVYGPNATDTHLLFADIQFATPSGPISITAFKATWFNAFTQSTVNFYFPLDPAFDVTAPTDVLSETVLPDVTEGMTWEALGLSAGFLIREDFSFGQLFGLWANDLVEGTATAEKVFGHLGDDSVLGGAGDDSLYGGAGRDTLEGGDDDDFLSGGADADDLDGGTGADTLLGGWGDDTLNGNRNADSIEGGPGADSLIGDKGTDTLLGGDASDTIDGGENDDSLQGNRGRDDLLGGDGNDTLEGGQGRDTLDGQGGDDLLRGGNGHDRVIGGEDNDTLRGGNGNDTIEAGKGDDLMRGEVGNDDLAGGRGNDTLLGDDGADTLNGGDDEDQMTGGTGADVFVMANDGALDSILDFEDGVDLIDLDVDFTALTISTITPGLVEIVHAGDVLVVFDTAGTLQASDLDASDFI